MKIFWTILLAMLLWQPARAQFVSGVGAPVFGSTSSSSGTGGTGGVLTNNTVAAVIANFYTNSTPHWIEGEARLGTSTAGRIQAAVTNSDNTLFFHYQNEVATAGALSNTISFKVPPGGWWKFIGLTTTATDGSQQLLYMATNGSVSFAANAGNAATVTDGATITGLAAGSYAINGVLATNLINTSFTYGRSIKANEFPYTFMTVQSNLPLRVLTVGDSVTAKGETTPALLAAFRSYMAFGGFGTIYGNDYEIAQDSVQFIQSGGLSTTSGDSHTTQPHFHLSNGQQYISSGAEVLANKLTLYYYADGAAGTMLVETQALGGSYGTLATINSALGTAHIATNFTLNTREYYRFRITSTGNNYLLDVGLTDTTTQRSQTWATKSTPGDTVTNIIYTPSFWNFFTNYNPHIVIIEAKDPADSILPAMDWFRNNATNSDIIYVAPSPNSEDAGLPAQCDVMFRYARTNTGISVFDKHALFYPTNHWIPITYSDSAHLNYKGVIRASQAFADWFNVDDSKFGVGGKTNIQYFSVLDSRLISAGAIQTTVPELLNEVYYGGNTLWQHGFRMNSGAPRTVGLYLPSALVAGKKNIAISQRWLTTNDQNIAHSCILHRLSFTDISRREKVGNTGGNVLSTLTGTNLVTYRVLNSFTQPIREGDYVFCELGHGGTLTNSIFWMGAKVEAY